MLAICLSFVIDSVEPSGDGWRLTGKPDFHPRHWPCPGERFGIVTHEHGCHERAVDLTVAELTATHAVVLGIGGDLLRPGDYLFGERQTPPRTGGPSLDDLLGLTPSAAVVDWSPVESALGLTLPGDFKRFVGAHGSGVIDDHIGVNGIGGRFDMIEENELAWSFVRIEFGGHDSWSETADWRLGDATHWEPLRQDIPAWFHPGDDLIAWGSTVHTDTLFWHARAGTPPDEWTVVLKERGPLWEPFDAGFTETMTGLLTGDLQSRYASRWLGGPHSYDY
ncbi:hypothetical protein [Actinoplanes subglobosus]|uniref:SMI1/KNR4 family protein n=1 Tax=Actinoplanes subglobosus TaxID=1547892 RepID=A0ABV8J5J8_9ACTN